MSAAEWEEGEREVPKCCYSLPQTERVGGWRDKGQRRWGGGRRVKGVQDEQ